VFALWGLALLLLLLLCRPLLLMGEPGAFLFAGLETARYLMKRVSYKNDIFMLRFVTNIASLRDTTP